MENREGKIEHIAFIMDGNRRWAKTQKKSFSEGHTEGLKTMDRILTPLFQKGISFISVYAFSLDNWNRTSEEIDSLHQLISRFRQKNIDQYKERGIRVLVSGLKEHLSEEILELLNKIQDETKDLTKGTLNICFNYGGRNELVRASQRFAEDVLMGKKDKQELTEESFKEYLFIPDIPDVDLLIRTSGEQRLSDFLLYQSAYAELFFTPTLWPDLTIEEVESILEKFLDRERRFGS